jgi:hypothetical protein
MRAGGGAAAGHHARSKLVKPPTGVGDLGHSEVPELQQAARGREHVGGLQVAVQDALGVRVVQRKGDLAGAWGGRGNRVSLGRVESQQRMPLSELQSNADGQPRAVKRGPRTCTKRNMISSSGMSAPLRPRITSERSPASACSITMLMYTWGR